MLHYFEMRTTERRLESKIEVKFPIFTLVKLGKGWAKCMSQYIKVHPSAVPLVYC